MEVQDRQPPEQGAVGDPSDAAVERAIASVPGVASASVSRDPDTARTRLRLRLRAGEDPEQVSWAVAATLRERFGIALDPARIRLVATPEPAAEPSPPPVPAPPAVALGPDGARSALRPTISRLDLHRDAREVRVVVGLSAGHRSAEGVARTVPTSRSVLRAVAEATALALQQLTVLPLSIGIDAIEAQPSAHPARVTVALTLLADRGEEPLLGVSVVRGDLERAVVRATLDALNRRVEPLLATSLTAAGLTGSGGGARG